MDDPGVESAYFDVPGARGVPIFEWARLPVDWRFRFIATYLKLRDWQICLGLSLKH